MGIGAIISLIFTVITNLPKIIGIVRSIIQLIHGVKDPAARTQAFKDLQDAYQTAHETGDTTKLNQLHASLSACAGKASELVKE